MAAPIAMTHCAVRSASFFRFAPKGSIKSLQKINGKPDICTRSFSNNSSNMHTLKTTRKYLTLGISGALGLGIGYSVYNWVDKVSNVVLATSTNRPFYNPSRSIKSKTDNTGFKLTLYQYQTCPFCCKVRAYLDYKGFSYDVIEVNSVWRTQIKWSDYKKVPQLVAEGQDNGEDLVLKESSVIISALESHLSDKSQSLSKLVMYYPPLEAKDERGKSITEYPNKYFVMHQEQKNLRTTEPQRNEERRWRRWTDKVLVHTLSPNVYRTPTEALQAFRYFSEVGEWERNFSTFERYCVIYIGAAAMFAIGKRLKKKYSLKDDVRVSLYDACKEWTKAIGKDRLFLGGNVPNLADLNVYGVLSSIEGCDAFQDLMANTKIKRWYYATKNAVETQVGADDMNIKAQTA